MDVELDWEPARPGGVPYGSEDRLLLAEANHRATSEIAAALAALELIKAARGQRARWRMLGEAVERLNGSAALHAIMAAPPTATVDVGREIGRLCDAVAAARYSAKGGEIALDLPRTVVDGATARRLCMIACELVTDVVRNVFAERGGRLIVTLRSDGPRVSLTVQDDGPGLSRGDGIGVGRGRRIVTELVERAGGRLSCDVRSTGTCVRVVLPYGMVATGKETRCG